MAEWYGPQIDVAPSSGNSQRSLGGFDAGARILVRRKLVIGIGTNGDGCALKAEIIEPLGPGLKVAGSPPKIGTSTPSYPIFLRCSRTGSMPSLARPTTAAGSFLEFHMQHRGLSASGSSKPPRASRPVEQFVASVVADEFLGDRIPCKFTVEFAVMFTKWQT